MYYQKYKIRTIPNVCRSHPEMQTLLGVYYMWAGCAVLLLLDGNDDMVDGGVALLKQLNPD